ncbi:MAG: hypothetical protein M3680_00425 [Myxococcota bacterium]|nr:hypothetical protein [Myxococcota bacterium]
MLLREPDLLLWVLYLVLFPVYVFENGLPQPGDLLILPLAPIVIARWSGRVDVPAKRAITWLLGFTLYTLVSAMLWTAVEGELAINLKIGFLLSPLFYIYNALAFLLVLLMHRAHGERFITITVYTTLIVVLLQVPLSALIGRHTGSRATGLFNNPNQLGYYAVLSASIIIFGQRRANVSTLLGAAGMLACTYLALISASKAAIVSVGLLILISSVTRLRTILASIAVATVLVLTVPPLATALELSRDRIESDEHASFLLERGYDRIWQHPEYWVLGSGEGAYRRFEHTTVIGDHELHSSGGTLFFCYGIAGSLVFLGFLFQVIRGAQLRQVVLLIPAAAYGLTHQGLRVTLLWVLLAMFLILGDRARRSKRSPATPPGRLVGEPRLRRA